MKSDLILNTAPLKVPMRILIAFTLALVFLISLATAVEFSSVKTTAVMTLPDASASINILNTDARNCFDIRGSASTSNSKTFSFSFNPTCSVCGKFPVDVVLPSRAETLTQPLRKSINIACKGDILIIGRPSLSTPSAGSRGLNAYIKRAAEDGLTVKVAQLYAPGEFVQPELPAGAVFLGRQVAKSQQTTGLLASSLDRRDAVAQVRFLRAQVKPRYIIILGNDAAIPQAWYVLTDNPFDEFTETDYYSDHAYGTAGESPNDKMVVSVSRIPLSSTIVIDQFLSKAALRGEVGKPSVLTIKDPKSDFVDRKTRMQIMSFYYGVNTCTEVNNCFYAPDTCVESDEDCNPAKFYRFLSNSKHVLFQVHGTAKYLLGPETVDHTYLALARAPSLGGGRVQGALVHFESCRALALVEDEKAIQNTLSSVVLGDGGALGMLGRTGKSTSIDLAGKKGRAVRMGDELVRLKSLPAPRDQGIKLSYYGDPLLKLNMG